MHPARESDVPMSPGSDAQEVGAFMPHMRAYFVQPGKGPFEYPLVFWDCVLALLATVFMATLGGYFAYAWDTGNSVYAIQAVRDGLTPNVDFRHGYPGLAASLEGGIAATVGLSSLQMAQIVYLSLAFASALLFSIFVRRFSSRAYGMLGALLVLYLLLQYQAHTPGDYVSLIFLGLLFISVETLGVVGLLALGGLLGLTVAVKQTAVLGIFYFGTLVLLQSRSRLALPALLAFQGAWATLMLGRGGDTFASAVYLVAPVAAAFAHRRALPVGDEAAPLSVCLSRLFLLVAGCFVGFAAALLFVYGLSADFAHVFQEIFSTVPRLIDRDITQVPVDAHSYGFALLIAPLFVFALLRAICRWTGGSGSSSVFYVGIVVTWFMLAYYLGIRVDGLVTGLFLPRTVALSLVAVSIVIVTSSASISPAAMRVILMGAYFVQGNVVFENLYSMTPLLVMGALVSLRELGRALVGSEGMVQMNGAAVLLSFALVLGIGQLLKTVEGGASRVQIAGNEVMFKRDQLPFVEVAGWLIENSSKSDKVSGYPNFAASFALAERTNNGFYPNFIGDKADAQIMVADIEGSHPPEIFVLAKGQYPYREDHPYFGHGASLESALLANYDVVKRINWDGAEIVWIFKRRAR